QILSRPIFESYYTDECVGGNIGKRELERLLQMDQLPKSIVEQLQENVGRNKRIVETYKKGQKKYGQTIVFALNVPNAIALSGLFNKAGIKADFVVSSIRDMATGINRSAEDNERIIESYRKGDTKVLINVNILTEGIDLPQTKTVFLTRPTVSTILMTQMVGRALRGEAAGGTKEAYIVSFIDQWNDYISWVSPESLVVNDDEFMDANPKDRVMYEMRLIAISKIEEFAKLLDDAVDTSDLERIPFVKRIPVGMYAFTCLTDQGNDFSYQVMVYDSTKTAYEKMMRELPELAKDADINEDGFVSPDELEMLAEQCRDTYFTGEMIPPYDQRDIMHVLQYFAQYGDVPKFHSFEDIDINKIDVTPIAQRIWDEDMGQRREKEYVDEVWNQADENLRRIFFPNKDAFLRQLSIEKIKISNPDLQTGEKNVTFGKRDIEDMTLHAIGKHLPEEEKRLRDLTFKKAKDKAGYYVCNHCGRVRSKSRIRFHVDHIKPMNKGGKTVPENLQILCRACNMRKGDME
ncbi:MAG: HNH endonuclease, partial [Lachnospiraceae bacterium]|nr:HNH endonuclease [Lachnospiraceae bacterium]